MVSYVKQREVMMVDWTRTRRRRSTGLIGELPGVTELVDRLTQEFHETNAPGHWLGA